MLKFEKLKRNRRKLLAFTGLTLQEFQALLIAFGKVYQRSYTSRKTLAGKTRQRQSGGRRRGQLKTLEQKLLFILVYQKTYPLQIVIGELFGMTQSAANQWIHRLLTILREALREIGVMPERDGRKFSR